jgi:hypothetical protein
MLIFLFGEVIPKNVAFPFAIVLSFIYALPFYIAHTLSYTLQIFVQKIGGCPHALG